MVRKLVLVKDETISFLWPSDDRALKDARVKLEDPGQLELGSELGCWVVQLAHVKAVARDLVELVDLYDKHKLGLVAKIELHLLTDLLQYAVTDPRQSLFVAQEVAILVVKRG